jgi:MATE family multidrug resistance protein
MHRHKFGTWRGMRINTELMWRILVFGFPSGLQILLDVAGFTIFIVFIGRLGDLEAEATSMAFSVSTLAFMPIYGLHLGVSVLVGEHLGENRDDLAARATYTSLQLSLIYMAVISLLYVFVPGIFLRSFFLQGTAASANVAAMAAALLRFVAGYNLLDATQLVFTGALKGAGDTRFLLRVSVLLAALLAGFSYLSVDVWRLNVYHCWTLIVFWCLIAATMYVVRFLRGKWRRMRVIEVEDAPRSQ